MLTVPTYLSCLGAHLMRSQPLCHSPLLAPRSSAAGPGVSARPAWPSFRGSAPLAVALAVRLLAAAIGSLPHDMYAQGPEPTSVDKNSSTDNVAGASIDYTTQIKPLLQAKCVACHGALQQQGELRLDTAQAARQGGSSGPAAQPGDRHSLLLERVTSADEHVRMPQEGAPLSAEQIALLETWILQGAIGPSNEVPEEDPREHWSFRPLQRPAVPAQASDGSTLNEIDAFLAETHSQRGITPQPPASLPLIIRRLYVDLLGVPPTWAEFQAASTALTSHHSSDRPAETKTLAATDHAAKTLAATAHAASPQPTPGGAQPDQTSQPDEPISEVGYRALVDRLLSDPRYGERWGRHWMDVWRYSDAWGLGDQHRNSQKHIWHWRDWIVESLNADVPYDEMVRQMLAADELYPEDLHRLRATGFLARNYFLFNRHQWMDETVEHVSKAFLGLTMNCAKCHDHKYDPIDQVDYYRLRAFFEPYHVRLDVAPGEPDINRDAIPRVFDREPRAPTYLLMRGQESQPDKSRVMEPGVPEVLNFRPFTIEPITLPVTAWQPARRPWVIATHLEAARQRLANVTAELTAAQSAHSAKTTHEAPAGSAAPRALAVLHQRVTVAQAELDAITARAHAMQAQWQASGEATASAPKLAPLKSDSPSALDVAATEARIAAVRAERHWAKEQGQLNVTRLEEELAEANADQKAEVEKKVATAQQELAAAAAKLAEPPTAADSFTPLSGGEWTPTRFASSLADDPAVEFGPLSSGRRSALAAWITAPQHPLTARVAVNHIWARHFGTPLVPNLFDFGRKGAPPAHPALLDWLAVELIESGWSMKHMHRLIVQSAAYQRSSSPRLADDSLARDPENQTYWRRTPLRLESQVIRDTILALAGQLDTRRGGPSIPASEQTNSRRRSLYFWHSDIDRNLFLTTFDEAAVKECYRREQSIVPQQALALINSELVLNAAEPIAQELSPERRASAELNAHDQQESDRAFIERSFVLLIGDAPTAAELDLSLAALASWREQVPSVADGEGQAAGEGANESLSPRAYFIWALLNHNDFVTLR